MTKLDEIDEFGRCKNCRSRAITYSTEHKDDDWIWKKLCESCNNMLEKQILQLS